MDSTKWISKKIALLGHYGVGKTSLISRFVYSKFPESYLTTIGLKVDKKTIDVGEYCLDLVIWDIAGQEEVANVPHFYLKGCAGVIYVFDLARSVTYANLDSQISQIRTLIPDAEILVAGNKKDLLSEAELEAINEKINAPVDLFTSAKEDQGVEELFNMLAQKLVSGHGAS
ncbi:MAG: Rab family GTPase [Bacteroidia bacterium]